MEGSSAMASNPARRSEREVYQKLIDVANQLKETKQSPRPIVVFTDVGKDYDDLAALLVLKEFHRLQLIELRAVVANLMPAEKRARFARAVLDSLGLRHVPVAWGTRGSPEDHEELKHELEFNEVESCGGDSVASEDVPLEEGQALLLKVYESAKENGEKLYLLCLSSLQDIHEFASNHSDLVANYTAEVYMQGGNYISEEGKLEPDCKAANNLFNLDAAKSWHTFIEAHVIPSRTYTKSVAFAAPLSSDVFVELEATGHPIGAYLRRVQVEQDLAFYERACESDSEKRFASFMDQEWFLSNKTNWPMRPHASDADALPKGKEVIPYLTKIVLYDVHAALGIAGDDVLAELDVLESKDRPTGGRGEGGKVPHHWISDNALSSAVAENICLAVSSLLKEALVNAPVGLSNGSSSLKEC